MPNGWSQSVTAIVVASLFFPQSKSLGIDRGSQSPAVLAKAVYAGVNGSSYQQAHADLRALAELEVTSKQTERLCLRIGQERCRQRDQQTADYLALPLVAKERTPPGQTAPPLAVVQMDGGRMQLRSDATAATSTAAPADPTPAGADAPPSSSVLPDELLASADRETNAAAPDNHWREDKVGCVMTMTTEAYATDPCPVIPGCFIKGRRVAKLVQGLKGKRAAGAFEKSADQPEFVDDMRNEAGAETARRRRPGAPQLLTRDVVATRRPADEFAPMLAAAAHRRGLAGAPRKAFLADGLSTNWAVHRHYFPAYTPILDFIHALTHVFAAALAGRSAREGWPLYHRWIALVWAGQVATVLVELEQRASEWGPLQPDDPETHPRRIVADNLRYLRNNQARMRYDQYRRDGLPITSSYIESVVKQINRRVKGTEKFWSEAGAEAILQLRADYLSDSQPMGTFWQQRPHEETGHCRYRIAV